MNTFFEKIVICSFKEDLGSVGLEERLDAVDSLFLLLAATCSASQSDTMRSVLRCVVSLCNVQKKLCPRFVQLIATCLMESNNGKY